jgi:2'-5' RNA ligase
LTLPSQMADRWQDRAEPRAGQGMLYWHILLGDSPQVRALASIAQERLARFSGLHFTPKRWLHVTTLAVGLIEDFTETEIGNMVARAREFVCDVPPAMVVLGKILYHPEAITLAVEPAGALDTVRNAIRAAAAGMPGMSKERTRHQLWVPHVTLAYSTSVQPAAPIIAALGRRLPAHTISVDCVNLVVQEGAERLWNWQPIVEIPLGAPAEGELHVVEQVEEDLFGDEAYAEPAGGVGFA